jgi:hypothetical protein
MMMMISKRTQNDTRVDTRKKSAQKKNPIALSRNVVVGTACVRRPPSKKTKTKTKKKKREALG